MRSRQASKAHALILILLVLLGLVLALGLLSAVSVHVRASPIVREAFWLVHDQQVSVARVQEEVEAHLVVKATEEYAGSIVVKVRKDIRL